MNRSKKGRTREYKSADMFRARGYVVIRSAGSKGDWDLVALGADAVLVQVKSRKPSRREIDALAEKLPSCARGEVHVWTDYARAPLVIPLKKEV